MVRRLTLFGGCRRRVDVVLVLFFDDGRLRGSEEVILVDVLP